LELIGIFGLKTNHLATRLGAEWAIVYFEQFFYSYRISPFLVLFCHKNNIMYRFWELLALM
jgi:hypothetical protein